MLFPSEQENNRQAIRNRQKAYLASLDAQVKQQQRKKAVEDAADGHFVRNLPATPDDSLDSLLLAPLPPVDPTKRGSPRGIGKGLKLLKEANDPNAKDGRRRYGKAYESGMSQVLGGPTNYNDAANNSFDPELQRQRQYQYPQSNQESNNSNNSNNRINLNYANNNDLLVNAVTEQLNKFKASQQRSESTIKWLTEQLQKNRGDYAKHTAMLVNQHTKDSETLAALRDRVRVAETEILETRAWRAEFERKRNEGVEDSASAAIAELRAREEDGKSRQQSEDNRARRMAESLAELTNKLEQVKSNQSRLDDDMSARLGVVENAVNSQTDKIVNLVDREGENVVSQHSASENNAANIVDLQNSLKQLMQRLTSEEEQRRQLQRSMMDMQSETRRLISNETETLHEEIVAEASARREGAGEVDQKTRFLSNIIEEREKANLGMIEDRIIRLEKAQGGESDMRRKKDEAREKEFRKFFSELSNMAKTETETMKSRHEAMTAQTTEQLRELSHEVVSIQETTRKAEKRIGELTAGSLQGISTAMESGMNQFNQDVKELREVMSAEITARRNGNDKVVARVEELESREEAGLSQLEELLGSEVRRIQDQIDVVPSIITAAKDEAKAFATNEADKVKYELSMELKQMTVRIDELAQHVEDVRVESKRAREHLNTNLERMNTHLSAVDGQCKGVELKLNEEIMAREKGDHESGVKLDEAMSTERGEREREDAALGERLSETNLSLLQKIEKDDVAYYNKSKAEIHELNMESQKARVELAEKAIGDARKMDEVLMSVTRKEIADHLVMAKSYADVVANEKSSKMHNTLELVRESLTKQTNAVKNGLDSEIDARVKDAGRANELIVSETVKLQGMLEGLKNLLDLQEVKDSTARNEIISKIAVSCGKVEDSMGQKIISEARSIRSLIKATVAAEASERMSDVNAAKGAAEARLVHERDILAKQMGRDKEFVLQKSAEWVDDEKAERMAAEQQIKNEMDVRTAAAKARAESRETLRMLGDQIQDVDLLNRHNEVVRTTRKLMNGLVDMKKDVGALREESRGGDKLLGEKVEKEEEERKRVDGELDEKFEGKIGKEVEERIEGDKLLGERVGKEEEERAKEVVRLDGRVDNLWEEEEKLVERVEKGEAYVKVVEESAAKAIRAETKARVEEDVEIRVEELCREGAEDSMRFVLDKLVGGLDAAERVSELVNIGKRISISDAKMQSFVNGEQRRSQEQVRGLGETVRLQAEAEHRDIVQLISDETGAVRGDVHNMLGEIEEAVKGAEGSVITLDKKTEEQVGEVKKALEEGLVKVKGEVMEEVKGGSEELKKEVMEKVKGGSEELKKSLGEEATKVAREMIESEIKAVKGKLENMEKREKEKEGIDWDALRKKGGVEGGAAPEVEKPKEEETGKLVD
ncbi:hypothetical protein TrRE_jg9651 [Triparma retinervis]|uniref:Uncharacterized protein n=1 Tax=Triparma retinervis TaxID=2557542 RepID=A0A9W7G5T6_9STRA|nr:hypothetical protein TrRE_jg9651 [Triparma retinervis]